MEKSTLTPNKKRGQRTITGVAAVGTFLLAACGGGAGASQDEVQQPTTTLEASPSEIPNTEVPRTVPVIAPETTTTVFTEDTIGGETGESSEALPILECSYDQKTSGRFCIDDLVISPMIIRDAESAQRALNQIADNINFGINNNSLPHIGNSAGYDSSALVDGAIETMNAVNAYRQTAENGGVDSPYILTFEVVGDPIEFDGAILVPVQEYVDNDPANDTALPQGEPFKLILRKSEVTYTDDQGNTETEDVWKIDGNTGPVN